MEAPRRNFLGRVPRGRDAHLIRENAGCPSEWGGDFQAKRKAEAAA